MVRRILLTVSLFLLIGAIGLLRSHRFERIPDESPVKLSDLRSAIGGLPVGAGWVELPDGPALRVTALPGSHEGLKFRLPLTEPVHALHIRLAMEADHLVPGTNEWEEGRILVQWQEADGGGKLEIDSVAAVSGGEDKDGVSLVARPTAGTAFPILLIENLGNSGNLLVTDLELTPVRERAGWKVMRWVLAFLWISWIVVSLSPIPKLSLLRRCAAAGAWIAMAALFSFPGPWKTIPPMVIPFDLGGDSGMHLSAGGGEAGSETKTPHGLTSHETHGKIPLHDNWIIQLKYHLKKIRPLLHVAFVFLATVVFLWIVGVKRASWLAAGLVVAIEASQLGFGFGFDWKDVLDLACGAAGIFLAHRVHARLAPRIARLPRMLAPPA